MNELVVRKRDHRWQLMLVGLAVAAVFGWLTFRGVDWPVAIAALTSANWVMFGFIPLILGLTVFIRAVRWRLLLPSEAERHLAVLYRVAGVGVAANAILPAKLGEVVSAHALGRLCLLSRVQAIGIVFIARAADLLVLSILVLVWALILPGVVPASVRQVALPVLAATGLGLFTLAVLPASIRQAGVKFLVGRVTDRIGGTVGGLIGKFACGLNAVTGIMHLVQLLACTLLLWLALALALWVATYAFDLKLAIHFAPLILGITTIGAVLPTAPGNVGTYHFFGVLALTLFGVSHDAAVACIIAYHAADILSCITIGAVCGVLSRAPLWSVFKPAAHGPTPAPGFAVHTEAQTEPEHLTRTHINR